MCSIEFGEEQLENLEEISKKLFNNESDPSNYSYKRVLIRPQIRWRIIALFVILPVIFLSLLVVILSKINVPDRIIIFTVIGLMFFYIFVNIKRAIICAVHIYQRYAPEFVRNKCRFEPSCSQYMILAIEKYGAIKGVKMGINRLKRCNVNNGGYDFP